MQRRRPLSPGGRAGSPFTSSSTRKEYEDHEHEQQQDTDKYKSETNLLSLSARSNSSSNNSSKSKNAAGAQPIVPLWLVAFLGFFLIALGFLQHHFNVLSSRDIHTSSDGSRRDLLNSDDRKNHKSNNNNNKKSLLTARQDAALEIDSQTNLRYHVVFSTDCSPYQHWQSYLVFYTALKVRQPGHVTRIASGCDPEQEAAMKEWFARDVQFLSSRFHLQLTPKFSSILDSEGKSLGDYKFFNKPMGLKYWMEHSPLLRFNAKTTHFPEAVHNDVVILIDPDMALLRPITADFSDPRETLVGAGRARHYRNAADATTTPQKVGPGQPFAQVYGFGAQWARHLDLEKIAGPGTPAASVSLEDARFFYPAGPPYLAVVTDMYNIAVHWSSFVPAVYEQYPHLLAEMFAFSIAAAHLELPFYLVDSLMVSDPAVPGGEGWELVEQIPAEQLCGFCLHEQDHSKYALPTVLHLCQRYVVGEDWFFTKRRVPSDIYDCETPLFAEPPDDLTIRYDYKHAPGGQRFDLTVTEVKRHSFALCFVYALLNEAASFYKQNSCPPDRINLAKTRNLVQYMANEKEAA